MPFAESDNWVKRPYLRFSVRLLETSFSTQHETSLAALTREFGGVFSDAIREVKSAAVAEGQTFLSNIIPNPFI